MENNKMKSVMLAIIPLIIAVISIFILSKYATSTDFHAKTIATLDAKTKTVMELTAASTASSAAITLLPGDAATPIADKLADLSSYFLLVLCAIYLEKYLVTITGYAAFIILIPVACVILSSNVFLKNETWGLVAKKMAIFGIAIVLVIPTSVKISNMIEETYNASIQETLDAAKESTEEIGESAEDQEDEKGLSGLLSKVTEGVTNATDKVENVLNNFIEALAVMIVTSCIIPIIILLFFFWLIKIILGVNMNLPRRINRIQQN